MKVQNKKFLIISVLFLLLAVTVGVILFCLCERKDTGINPDTVVATVDGEPIVFAELCFAAGDIRSDVISYFYNTYSAEQTENFWQSEFNGENPNSRLYSLTFEEAVRIKTEQLMMREYGIADDLSYKSFYDSFMAENKRRAKAIENDEIIYGPKQYTEISYFEYIHNNRLLKLKAAINKKISGGDELDYSGENFDSEYQKIREKINIKPINEIDKRLKKEFYKLIIE